MLQPQQPSLHPFLNITDNSVRSTFLNFRVLVFLTAVPALTRRA